MTYDEFLNFLEKFEEIKSFAGKIKSANENLTRIGSGSGRIVYDIDGEKVFKLAKNQKGTAQNEAEINIGTDYYTQSIVTKVYEYSEDYTWIIAEKAKKVSGKRIEELTGIPKLALLYYYLRNFESENKGGRAIFGIEPKIKEELNENEFVHELLDLMNNYNVISGDLGRPSSYGEVLRDGQPTIVVTDYGLNSNVYNTHYDSQRKQKYGMYEIYNFADGNDDILSDANGGNDIRRGMWALMPQGVGDGDEPMDDEFISYIQERSKYPDKPISNLLFLNDKFHECVNNLKETLNHIDNKKNFYNNLLALQEYLISQGVYDREKIELQEYEINEDAEIPLVKAFSLDDEVYARQLVDAATAKLGLKVVKYLGGGSNGFAYDIGDGKVFKISADVGEADAASKLLRENPVYIAKVYNLYKIIDTEKNLSYFGIIEENVQDKRKETFRSYYRAIDAIMPNNMTTADFLIMMKKKDFNYDNLVQLAQGILNQNPEANISPELRQEAYNYLIGLLNIKKELLSYEIKSNDYGNPENIGYSNGVLKYFDFGAYRAEEPNMGDNIIMLPENVEIVGENYERSMADSIANQISTKLNLNQPKYISGGTFGVAYDIGNDLVLKITKDKSEASENLMLIGKQLNYIAKPFRVFEINSKNKDVPQTYAIILEKLQTSPEIQRLYNRLDFAFGSILDVRLSEVVEEYLGLGTGDIDKSKVDAYLRKNPQDAEFFGGLLKIAEEAHKLGIESMDFYNWRNLGYKKNGALGFFDVGFGNGFLQPHGAEAMEVTEEFGGSSLYSTTNTVGSDDTPIYNQNDTSPLTDNNIPTSIDELTERILSSMKGSSTVDVKKKCRLGGLGNTSVACNQGDINNLKIKKIDEEIDASEATDVYGALQTILDGKRNIALTQLYRPDVKKIVADNNLKIITVNQTNHPNSLETSIVYRNGYEKQANRLYNIMKSHGGYVSDKSPREAYEIGKLLEYTDESILQYINRIYVKLPNGEYRHRTNAELQQYDDKRIKQIPSEEEEFKKYLAMDETLGELDKVYVRTGLYDDEDRKEILDITHGDNYTKFIADIFYYLANRYNKKMVEPTRLSERDRQILIDVYNRIKKYDKNVLPIHDLYAREHNAHPLEKMNDLRTREVLIDRIKTLPSILLRNLRADIRKERDHYELEKLLEYTRNIEISIKLINQTKPEHREKIIKKVFSSANDTFEAVSKRLEDTTIPYLSQDDSVENTIEKISDVGSDDAELLYNKNDILVVKIKSPEAMGYIGCSSQWCFATNPHNYWNNYTSGDDGFATIVFNFNEEPSEPNAMVVVLESGDVYNMYNEYMENGDEYLNELGVSKYIPHGEYEMAENSIFAKKNMNEAITSLQDLPFKQEVEQLGGKIFSVGGAVRDEFLGKESKDLDILISGIPMDKLEEILGKYGRVDAVGKSFGILKFKPEGSTEDIDIAIPRTEKPTGEGGHKGFEVSSSHELPIEKDLERRDFTINAIAKDSNGNIIDPYGGQKDLQNKIIRVVNPEAFSDDPLRMLRAVQFASRFGFKIEQNTLKMIQDNASRIKEIPPERILTEFEKIVNKGNKLTGVQLLKDTGLFQQIFGFDIKQSTINRSPFENVKTMGEFIYLLTRILPNSAEFYKNNLKGDINTYKEIRALEIGFSKEINNIIEARAIAHNMYLNSQQSLNSQIIPDVLKTACQELLRGKYPKAINELAVNGNDLMQLGLKGKEVGDALKMMLIKIYSNKIKNDKEDLLALVQ